MVQYRVLRRGFEKVWLVIKSAHGGEPIAIGDPYLDIELAEKALSN